MVRSPIFLTSSFLIKSFKISSEDIPSVTGVNSHFFCTSSSGVPKGIPRNALFLSADVNPGDSLVMGAPDTAKESEIMIPKDRPITVTATVA